MGSIVKKKDDEIQRLSAIFGELHGGAAQAPAHPADVEELQQNLANATSDVESKAAATKHLQNALNAKSMTIEILSKHNKEGGDLEERIANTIQEKMESKIQ